MGILAFFIFGTQLMVGSVLMVFFEPLLDVGLLEVSDFSDFFCVAGVGSSEVVMMGALLQDDRYQGSFGFRLQAPSSTGPGVEEAVT